MKKVSIVNNVNGMQFGAKFEADEAMNAWIAEQQEKNSWGLPERWLPEFLEGAETKVEEEITYYKWPCEYEVTITDLTNDADYLLEQALAKSNQNLEFGKSILALVGALVDTKNLSCEQVATLNSSLVNIVVLLQTGSIETAKNAIAAITPDAVITQNDINLVVGKMNEYLGL